MSENKGTSVRYSWADLDGDKGKIIGTLTVIVDPVTNDFELRVDGRSISGSSGHLRDGEVWFDDGHNLIDGIAVLVGKALIPCRYKDQ